MRIDVVLGLLVFGPCSATTGSQPRPLPSGSCGSPSTPLVVVAVLTLASGVVLGLGTRYGRVRYWWVAVKLVVTVVLLVLVVRLLTPEVDELSDAAALALTTRAPLPNLDGVAFPPVVSGAAVIFATVISVFKPWGRTRRRPPSAVRPQLVSPAV